MIENKDTDLFCVDCDKITKQKYKGILSDGSYLYICKECGCENTVEKENGGRYMYWVDRFAGQIVKEKDKFAPPERYYEYRKGKNGIIKETYIVSYNPMKLIDFSYAVGDDRNLVSIQRDNLFKENNISINPVLFAYTVPPEWYEQEIAKVE